VGDVPWDDINAEMQNKLMGREEIKMISIPAWRQRQLESVFDAAMAARDALRLASSYLSDPEPQSNELIWRLLDALRKAEEVERE